MKDNNDFPEFIEEKQSIEDALQGMMSNMSNKMQELNQLLDAPTNIKIILAQNLNELEKAVNDFLPTQWIKKRSDIQVIKNDFVVVIEYYLTTPEIEND